MSNIFSWGNDMAGFKV